MKLLDIVNNSSFILSRNKREVTESLESVIYKITGQYLSKSKHEKSNCAVIYKLIQKYIKRKVNKEKFVKLEREWLANEEVNIWKSLKWTGRLKTDILKD